MILSEWAARWGVPAPAMADLMNRVLGLDGGVPAPAPGASEAAVQSRVRFAASRRGMLLFRNNVGVMSDPETRTFVRYGLANDSPSVNAAVKSADLIGLRARLIQPSDVGHLIGQFVSYECKRAGWHYTGTEREKAQAAWATLIQSHGGEAKFVTDEGQI